LIDWLKPMSGLSLVEMIFRARSAVSVVCSCVGVSSTPQPSS